MSDYQYLQYETLDDGAIARILLDRPDARNAQNRGLLVELDDAFGGPRPTTTCRVVILGGTGPDVLVGPRHGLAAATATRHAGPEPAPDRTR